MTQQTLQGAIYSYRAGWYAYLAASLIDDDTPRTYQPALKIIENWSTPAADLDEADEAMALAIEFYDMGDSAAIPAMMMAVSGYLASLRAAKQAEGHL